MTVPIRFDALPPERKTVIQANLAKMQSMKAPDADVESYLRDVEHIAPTDQAPAEPDRPGLGTRIAQGVTGAVTQTLRHPLDTAAGLVKAPIKSLMDAVLSPGVGEARHNPNLSKGGNSAQVPHAHLTDAYDAEHGGVTTGERNVAGVQTLANVAFPGVVGKVGGGLAKVGMNPLLAKTFGTAAGGGMAGAAYSPDDPMAGAATGALVAPVLGGAGKVAGKVLGGAGSLAVDAIGRPMESRPLIKAGPLEIGQIEGQRPRAVAEIAKHAAMDQQSGHEVPDLHPSLPRIGLDIAGENVRGLAEGIANRPGPGRALIQQTLKGRQALMRPALNHVFDQATGTTSESGAALVRNAATEQTQHDALTGQAKQIGKAVSREQGSAPARTPLQAFEQVVGPHNPDVMAPTEQAFDTRATRSNENYGSARVQTKGVPINSKTFDEIIKTPAGKQALRMAMARQGNMFRELPGGGPGEGAPPGFSVEQWKGITAEMQRRADAESNSGVWKPTDKAAPAGPAEVETHIEAGKKADYSKASKQNLLDLLRSEQGVLDKESVQANHGWSAVDENMGIGRGGSTLGAGMARKRGKYAIDRLTAIEHELTTRHGMDADEVMEHRFGSPDESGDFNLDFGDEPAAPKAPHVSAAQPSVQGRPFADQNKAIEIPSFEGTPSPDAETLHLMKQHLRKMQRMGNPNDAMTAEAFALEPLLAKVRGELAEPFRKADESHAADSRIVEGANTGRQINAIKSNPAGKPGKAINSSLSAVTRQITGAAPEVQAPFRESAQSALGSLFRNETLPKNAPRLLMDPASDLSRRLTLATGDASTPRRLAQSLQETVPQQVPEAPPLPQFSQGTQAAQHGLRVLQHGVSSPDALKTLAMFGEKAKSFSPDARPLVQEGVAQALRGEFDATRGTIKRPGQVFDFDSPERAQQMMHAFPSWEDAAEMQHAVKTWDRAAQHTDEITGNSRTALRGAHGSGKDVSQPLSLLSGGKAFAKKVFAGMVKQASTESQQRMEGEIARLLTQPDIQALPMPERVEAVRGHLLKRLPPVNLMAAVHGGSSQER